MGLNDSTQHRRFDGLVALVTGAGGGIGRACALQLSAEGASVAVVDINGAAAASVVDDFSDQPALAIQADVLDPEAVDRAVQDTVRAFGQLNVLVNSAGILRSTPASDINSDEWDLVTGVNLKATFLCCRAVFTPMKSFGGGRIVNVASLAGRATSTLGGAHYTAAKAGALGLTRHLAREWAGVGIAVNAISPGIVDTDMVRSTLDTQSQAALAASIPFRRFAEPREIAMLVAFLASDDASYITGANVDIHGGELIIA